MLREMTENAKKNHKECWEIINNNKKNHTGC